MSKLNTFSTDANVVVVGAHGGIGSALLTELQGINTVTTVNAFSRNYQDMNLANVAPIDLEIEESISNAAESAASYGPIDLVIVATGLLHSKSVRPEKSMRQLNAESMQQLFAINTIGPALLAKHFLPKMRRSGKSVFATLSARVGSIADNHLGGWSSYRASKAALNMIVRTLAHEHRRSFPDGVIVGLHPGTVDTPLSAPFQKNVPPAQLFSATKSARCLLAVIDELGSQDSGLFFAWDGRRIEF